MLRTQYYRVHKQYEKLMSHHELSLGKLLRQPATQTHSSNRLTQCVIGKEARLGMGIMTTGYGDRLVFGANFIALFIVLLRLIVAT